MARPFLSHHERSSLATVLGAAIGAALAIGCVLLLMTLVSHSGDDASRFHATLDKPQNVLGPGGAEVSDDLFTWLGYSAYALLLVMAAWSFWLLFGRRRPEYPIRRIIIGMLGIALCSAFLSAHGGQIALERGYGGILGDRLFATLFQLFWFGSEQVSLVLTTLLLAPATFSALLYGVGGGWRDVRTATDRMAHSIRDIANDLRNIRARRVRTYESTEGAYPRAPRPFRFANWRRQRAAAEQEPYEPVFDQHAPHARPAPTPTEWRARDDGVGEDVSYEDAVRAAQAAYHSSALGDWADPHGRQERRNPHVATEDRYSPPQDAPRFVPPAPESRRIEPGFSSPPRQIGDGAPLNEDGTIGPARYDPDPLEARSSEYHPVQPRRVRRTAPPFSGTETRPTVAPATRSKPSGSFRLPFLAPKRSSANGAPLDPIVAKATNSEPGSPLGGTQYKLVKTPVPPAPEPVKPAPSEASLDELWRVLKPELSQSPNAPSVRAHEMTIPRERRTIGRFSPGYAPPPMDLLDPGRQSQPDPELERRLAHKAERLQQVINEYGVRGDVIDVSPGPVVSQFEFEPGPGVKVARVVGLADDIARAMSAVSARVAPIPGKNVIGIEIPNTERETVTLRTLLENPSFITDDSALPMALGVDLTGKPITVDLARAPHLLIAGATGSGKSVAVNSILLSLLYRLNPDELRLLLIDPKKLELSDYTNAPHLLSPVVTDAREAVAALKWAVGEMERRYDLMSKLSVRGVEGYNARAETVRRSGGAFEIDRDYGVDPETGAPIRDTERLAPDPLPRIVVIIDEMADLMMAAGKEIEHCVLRLAQMGRASGIHLVAATQRPSVDVITGLIKANFPTRISLQTVSVADSKTILDRPGAERLLGKGDMLYSPGGGRVDRIHGAFVTDEEVISVAAHLARQGPADDLISFAANDEQADTFFSDGDAEQSDDGYYERAKRIVLAEKRASASFLQRRLSIGYNRASRLIEQMERDGVVSPLTAAGKREVLAPQDAAFAAK